jgi:hypothetical protein
MDLNERQFRLLISMFGRGVRINVFRPNGTMVISLPIVSEQDWRPMLGTLADLDLCRPEFSWRVEKTSEIMFDLFRL